MKRIKKMKTSTKANIEAEVYFARAKHPLFATNKAEGISIIGEEFGELCKAINEGDYKHSKLEALHVIATCIRFVEEL